MTHVAPHQPETDDCPVTEGTFQQLLQSNVTGAAEVTKTLPEEQRSRLAVFCYKKAHLRPLGMAIAATCSRRSLVEESGTAGELIYSQSRDPQIRAETEMQTSPRGGKRAVSLHIV